MTPPVRGAARLEAGAPETTDEGSVLQVLLGGVKDRGDGRVLDPVDRAGRRARCLRGLTCSPYRRPKRCAQ